MIDIQHHGGPAQEEASHYTSLDMSFRASRFDGSAAQAHGIACGLISQTLSPLQINRALTQLNFTEDAAFSAMESLMAASLKDLNQAEFGFDLLLPDDAPLPTLSEAVAEWSQGYIIGLLTLGDTFIAQLPDELQDSIQDIVSISGMDSTLTQESGDDAAFVEIREYLRMAVQLIFEEMNPDQPLESAAI